MLWELEAFRGNPAATAEKNAKLALPAPPLPTPRRWVESRRPQLHQLKPLGGGGSCGHRAVAQTQGWCYGSLASCTSRRKGCNLTTEDRWHESLLPTAAARESRHSCSAPNAWCPEQLWRRGQQLLSPGKLDSLERLSLLHPRGNSCMSEPWGHGARKVWRDCLTLASSFYRWANWVPERACDSPKVTPEKREWHWLCFKGLNAAAHGCVSGPEPKCCPNGYLIILRTMPCLLQAASLKMALSNCHGFRINCLLQSIPRGKK